ncbi:DDB1- and CUL4-associated factor 13 isoform X2 [Hydra vulgaris]|uniref:DDB1- and CUL4-associated factor 13 isoform X2 n=1 Tax=Hydra vulgaris TaxID=6087 RepID=A0ABM4BQR6_HYDVU
MKVKVLSRNPEDYIRGTTSEINRLPRNLDPDLHPFEAAREYTRALNAAKLERVFAKPFLASLDGHSDGVNCLARNPVKVSSVASGACDGQIKFWHLQTRSCQKTVTAHSGFVRGITFSPSGQKLFSVGDDKTIKQWDVDHNEMIEPISTYLHSKMMTGIHHHGKNATFATCGEAVEIWDENRSIPVQTYSWGVDTVHSVKFNPIETHLVAATASDRSIMLYDTRGTSALRKVIMKMRSNTIAWNPMEAFIFSAANEDSNAYTFDIRKLDSPVNVHIDHVGAVLDIDYSPTGQEFVTGSFDKTIRIFPRDRAKSREVYHTSRMQRVFCVTFSGDATYVLSGSDETNIRLWKSHASEKLGPTNPRQRRDLKYSSKLKNQYQHHPEVKRILKHRHVPKLIHKEAKEKRIMLDSIKRKEENMRLHSKPGSMPVIPERKKHIVTVKK